MGGGGIAMEEINGTPCGQLARRHAIASRSIDALILKRIFEKEPLPSKIPTKLQAAELSLSLRC